MSTRPSDPIRQAVQLVRKLPGIGEKSATRLVYFILRSPKSYVEALIDSINALGDSIEECDVCCNFTGENPCTICSHSKRDGSTILVVEHPQNILPFERSGEYSGRYHVLHGAISPMEGIQPDSLRIQPLLERLRSEKVKEIILATDPDVEGDATALYLSQLLKPIDIAVTRLAHGISVGTEIEYADAVSLVRALQNRHAI